MPTPVSTARQCLTSESVTALDDAVTVARRRGHTQTTSLHLVSSLLSLPSSTLRDACSRTRNSAYSTRVQFKALELCLSVSLDRLPSSPNRVNEPPISNSLMAAIKRSQANQRRQPENFNLYNQQSSSQCSTGSLVSVVKVELQNFILSVLDDPVVSRVFGEAGFRSCDIKLAIIRPVHGLFRYSKYKGPPVFLCNLSSESECNLGFPFLGLSSRCRSSSSLHGEDENCRRIGEVMVRNASSTIKGRNPLLVGVCAHDALKSFLDMVKKGSHGGVLPVELNGVGMVDMEDEIVGFVSNKDYDEGILRLKLEEVRRMVEGNSVVVSFGDLRGMASDDSSIDASRFVVSELGRLVEAYSGRVWLIGAAWYETYLKVLNRFPSIEKDWDLQLLPITSFRPSSVAESYPRSRFMESFIPFGGFFSTPSDFKSPLSSSYMCVSRCNLSDDKCEQEVTDFSKGGPGASVADGEQSILSPWPQATVLSTNNDTNSVKAKDDNVVLSTRIAGLQKKRDNIFCHHPYNRPLTQANVYLPGSQIPTVVGFQVIEERKENTNTGSSNFTNTSTGTECNITKSCMSMEFQQNPGSKESSSLGASSAANKQRSGEASRPILSPILSDSDAGDGHTSPASVNSVTTNLGLGMYSASSNRGVEKFKCQIQMDPEEDLLGCLTANAKIVSRCTSNWHPSPCSGHNFCAQIDEKDFKMLYMSLAERIGRQEEAIKLIAQTIIRCRMRNEKRNGISRGDIWLNLYGPDRLSKKKMAASLAEVLLGSKQSLISVDLALQDEIVPVAFDPTSMDNLDLKFSRKTVLDYIAEKLSKKPLSVVFLENIEKADQLVQTSLLQAVMTGKLAGSCGREIGISNAIFVTTCSFIGGGKTLSFPRETTNYSEEDILKTKARSIQLLIGFDLGDEIVGQNSSMLTATRKGSLSSENFANKRRLICNIETIHPYGSSLDVAKRSHKSSNMFLDLNLPAEDTELGDSSTCSENLDCDSAPANSSSWLEKFLEQIDERVLFKPVDFDALAGKLKNEITDCFRKTVGSECLLEIDSMVIQQILAAAYLTDTMRVENWVQHVLSKAFAEMQEKYCLTARSTIKLVTSDGFCPEDQTVEAYLPPRILMN